MVATVGTAAGATAEMGETEATAETSAAMAETSAAEISVASSGPGRRCAAV
jgi:hypothetical protein